MPRFPASGRAVTTQIAVLNHCLRLYGADGDLIALTLEGDLMSS
jgi:hypothetical protein